MPSLDTDEAAGLPSATYTEQKQSATSEQHTGQTQPQDVRPWRLPAYALLAGNFIVGLSVLAPAAMLKELAAGLGVSIGKAGLLVTFGAIVLCIGSPLLAWATSRIERRTLLVATAATIAAGYLASALAPDYAVLLAIRLITLAVAAIFTPQAASAIALIAPGKERAAAIALVFLGWSLAVAAGMPLVTYLAATLGWREAYGVLAAASVLCVAGLAFSLPKGLTGTPVSFRSWGAILHSRPIVLMLLITILAAAGQFIVFIYLGPLLAQLAGAGPREIALFFCGFGITGFLGNLAATRIVGKLGAFTTSAVCFLAIFLGMLLWSAGAASVWLMAAGILIWGLGFAAANSMQQARLAGAAPDLASATIALNSSSIYAGQMTGSAIGGILIEHSLPLTMGYAGTAFLAAALGVVMLTRPRG
jgi:MFS transporter, DHA1 family, inner membrane transport protein